MDSYFFAVFFILTNILQARMKKRRPQGFEHSTLGDAIDKYIAMSRKEIGKTKTQVLRSIKTYRIANMDCTDIKSTDIIATSLWMHRGAILTLIGSPQTSP